MSDERTREEQVTRLSTETAMSREQAERVVDSASMPAGLRYERFDELTSKPDVLEVEVFMANQALDRVGMRELLREFRSEAGWSPFDMGQRDVLCAEFLNWFEWERLG